MSDKTPAQNSNLFKREETFNLAEFAIATQARKQPGATALIIVDGEEKPFHHYEWSYSQVDKTIRSVATNFLERGLKKGDHILLRQENDAALVFAFFGAIAAGLVPIPLSPKITKKELAFFIEDTQAQYIVRSQSLTLPENIKIEQIPDEEINTAQEANHPGVYANTCLEDPAFLIYSSGTSTQPKGIFHAQRTILGRLPMQKGWHDIQAMDRVLHAGDFNWTYTLGVGLMDPWVNGATAVLYKGQKSPEIWPKLISEFGITIFAAVPSLYRRILKYNVNLASDITSLRHGLVAGEALSETLNKNWQKRTSIPLYEAMGQSEISTYVSTSPQIKCPKSCKGKIQESRTVVILPEQAGTTPLSPGETGMIAVHKSDPGLMLGYWQRENEMTESFRGEWFLTGDLGSLDEDNNLTHYGRSDEIMNASGYRVSPYEVEAVLLEYEGVNEAAVTEIAADTDLSIIAAFIVTNKNKPDVLNGLQKYLKNNLASYKHPRSIQLVDKLPRNNAGKLLRKELVHSFKKLTSTSD